MPDTVPSGPPYDPYGIRRLLDALNMDNPGRDEDTRKLFERILALPDKGGLPPNLIAELEKAVQTRRPRSTVDNPR